MDATQTSDPTGVGPGTPGQASAFRRALDEQALDAGVAKEGPLDLTVPLDFAEIRAALSSSGSNRKPHPPEDLPPPPAAGRRGRRRGGEHAAPPGHAGSKRLGRIGVFVALATALSVGTAAALVLSSGGQGASVSLPTTNGNLPVATVLAGGPGQVPTSSASAGLSPSPSAGSATPSASLSAPRSAGPSASGGSQASSSPSAGATQSQAPAAPTASAPAFTTLQQGSSGAAVTEVQQMLAEVDLLYQQQKRHDTVFVDVQDRYLSDPSGSYGDATAYAVAAFQQENGVGSQWGVCDQATFAALSAQAQGQ